MTTDFTYGNKAITTSGPTKPATVDSPNDLRTRAKTFADIRVIPMPYVGMIVTVLADETNNGKMTDYKVLSLKANNLGIPNTVINEIERYVDYLGAGNVSQDDINTAVNNYLSENPVVTQEISGLSLNNNILSIKDTKGNDVGSTVLITSNTNSCLGLNIEDFPRLEDETTDSPRIQRAFDTLPDKSTNPDGYYKGLSIYFPSGEYIINSTCTGTNISIIGDSTTVFKGTGSGYMFDITYDGELGFAHVQSGAQIYQWRNFSFEKCQFNGNGKMNGVKHSGGHNIVLRDCVFLDTVDYGYYIYSGSKYLMDHVTFRGYTDNTSINKVACYLGGSDHNINNIICANYTKAFEIKSPCTIFNQCHHWLNHNSRLSGSVMYNVNAKECLFTDSYLDTVKVGFNINSSPIMIKGVVGYNNGTFSLSGANYIKNNVSGLKCFVSSVYIDDTKNANFWSGDKTSTDIKVIGILGNCNNIFETYGVGASSTEKTYAITSNLTNASLSNKATSVVENASYTTTVTASNGCTIDTVTVTMGGTDITSSAYNSSSKTITISAVTGSIVITVTTTGSPTQSQNIVTNFTYENDKYFDSTGNLVQGSPNVSLTTYFEVNSNSVLEFSADFSYCNLLLTICEYDNNKNFIQRNKSAETNSAYSITTSSTTKYIRVGVGSSGTNLNAFRDNTDAIINSIEVTYV